MGGSFSASYNSTTTARLVRFNSDGTPDTAFNLNLNGGFNNSVQTITVLSDGKIVVGGQFTQVAGVSYSCLVMLNSDGTINSSFMSNMGAFGGSCFVYNIKEQTDGKIVVGGSFTSYGGNTVRSMFRLNADGTQDDAFATALGTGFGSGTYVRTVEIQPDGKIVAAGSFTTFNGLTSSATQRLLRLNSDGSRDDTFLGGSLGGNSNYVFRSAQDSSGHIYLAGSFHSVGTASSSNVARLNADGSVDTAFTTQIGTGTNAALNDVTVQADDKVILSGNFTSFNGTTVSRIVRLNSDGSIDSDFTTDVAASGTGFNSQIQKVETTSTGIWIGGNFTTYNSATSSRFIKFSMPALSVTLPVITLTSTSSDPLASGAPFTLNISSTKPLANMATSSLSVSNGTLSSLTISSSTAYSVVVTPVADGTITVTLATSTVSDLVGNANASSSVFSIVSGGSSGSGSSGVDLLLNSGSSGARTGGSTSGGCDTQFNKVGRITYAITCGNSTIYRIDPEPTPLSGAAGVESGNLNSVATSTEIIATSTLSLTPQTPAVTPTFVSVFKFLKNLHYKDLGDDVLKLQQFLNTHGFVVSKIGPGSLGKETTFFGPATRGAVIKFQKAYSIKPAVGYFGPITRGVVNGLLK